VALFDLDNGDEEFLTDFDEGKLSPGARKKSATVKPSKDHPTGRFPMPDKKHARLALQMLGRAKGLSAGQKKAIRARANKILGKGKK
jgi:hypothetical protein